MTNSALISISARICELHKLVNRLRKDMQQVKEEVKALDKRMKNVEECPDDREDTE
jgi:uncharacterized protein YlxW (UPF0749 family)